MLPPFAHSPATRSRRAQSSLSAVPRSFTRRFVVPALVMITATFALVASPALMSAQQATPLRKSELVRLLTGGTYAQEEITAMVTRSCLAFLPTARDRDDLRALGASRNLLAAVHRCAQPPESVIAPSTERVFVAEQVEVTAGDTARILALATREGRVEAAVALRLLEPSNDAERLLAEATTGEHGEATLVLEAGAVAGVRTLQLRRSENQSETRDLSLIVRPAAPVRALVVPGTIRLPARADTVLTVLILPRDAFGNAVTELDLVLERRRVGSAPDTLDRINSGSAGLGRLALGTVGLRQEDVLHVTVDGVVLGTAPVARAPDRGVAPALLTVRAMRLLEEAEERMAHGELDAALRLYDQVLAASPGNPDAMLGRGQALSGLEQRSDAEQALLDLLRVEPGNAGALTQLGLLQLAAGRASEAEEIFLMALNAAPGQSRAAHGYASAALYRGNIPLAIRLFEDAIELFPDDPELLSGLGEALLADDRLADAASAFQRALELEPLLESARRGLARVER